MPRSHAPREHALFYHRRLPRRIWRYLRRQGLPDALIHRRLIGWDGKRLTVPVFSREGKLVYFEYLSDPMEGPLEEIKRLRYQPATLYGYETIRAVPDRLFIVEDVWERLVAESRGLRSVAVLGDPFSFKDEWGALLQPIREVYVLFKRSGRSHRAGRRVLDIVPHARLLELPPEVAGGGVADFFTRLGRDREDFLRLLPPYPGDEEVPRAPRRPADA